MIVGSIFFDTDFHFHDGDIGEKLFLILGLDSGVVLVAKTTSQPYGKGIIFGCQPSDRFHNFYLPVNSSYLTKNTWICLDEFYELKNSDLLKKHFSGHVKHICNLTDEITLKVQQCALESDDITGKQSVIIQSSLITF